jgi:hypothetical protein
MSELANSIKNYRPLYFYVVHELEDGIYGHLVDWKPAWEAQKDYLVVYKFIGREATYWIASHDPAIFRQDALSFAVRVHAGKCRVLHCDTAGVGR